MAAEPHPIREHEKNFVEIKDDIKSMKTILYDDRDRITKLETCHDATAKVLENRVKELIILERLVVGVEHLGQTVADVANTVANHDTAIEALKLAPGKRATAILTGVIMAIITGLISIILTLIFTGSF